MIQIVALNRWVTNAMIQVIAIMDWPMKTLTVTDYKIVVTK